MLKIIIKQITVSDTFYEALLDLRDKILRKPLGMNLRDEDISKDKNDYILAAFKEEKIVGCVMLKQLNENEVKLRAMAVDIEFQGKGIGKLLVEIAEIIAREKGFQKMMLHARITAKDFYKKLGYKILGKEFIEVSIPHIAMQKSLG